MWQIGGCLSLFTCSNSVWRRYGSEYIPIRRWLELGTLVEGFDKDMALLVRQQFRAE